VVICIGLPGHALEKVFSAVSLAHEDARTPMLAALTGFATAVAGAFALFPAYGHVGIAAAIGMLLGAAAGYYGGVVDNVVMRLVDLMLVFPRFFLLLAVLAFLKPSIWTIMTVIGLTGWMGVARLVRAEFLTLREREFVIWSESVGAGALRIIFRHILPNAIAPILVAMTLGIPAAILTEAGLSFLGLGVQPPYATWGNILNDGRDYIEIAWWLTLYPGLAILITVLSYNLMGEGIRDALDPRLRQSRVGRILRLGR